MCGNTHPAARKEAAGGRQAQMDLRISRSPELGLAPLRAVLGIVFVAHGWQMLFVWGHAAVAAGMAKSGIPFQDLSAWLLSLTQFLGGALLLLGLFARIAALPVAFSMAVAFFQVHLKNGFFIQKGGVEFVLVLFVALLTVAIAGPGAFALDNVLGRTRRPVERGEVRLRPTA
ncbi:MAG TPA: DoxX family protein [Terriglobales bacterium]|nr:DoxX family protein [Terriglobales bacterium]